MKVLIVTPPWIGGLFENIAKAFEQAGNEVSKFTYNPKRSIYQKLKLHYITQVNQKIQHNNWVEFNKEVISQFECIKPDLFIAFNESMLYSTTIEHIRNSSCYTISFVADNPFDPMRFSYFPVSLKYYNLIFVHDKTWIPSIKKVAKDSVVEKIICGGAFSPREFFPVTDNDITDKERDMLASDVSFTGESYRMRGEAGYRSDILDYLKDFNVKIWGDSGWKLRFHMYKNLERFYQGERLSYDLLRKLYAISTINLNMPSPQIFSGFQPRTFEIAACKGFQIADWREELDEFFAEDELVTFKTTDELIDKVEYFTKYPEKRKPYIDKLYENVIANHTWDIRIKELMTVIKSHI